MSSQAEIRDWCEQQNTQDGAFARSVWYFAIPDNNNGYIAARIDGIDAEETRSAARGIFPAYAGWNDANMRKHVGLVKYRLQMGMSEPSFQSIVARWPRAAENRQPVEKTHFREQYA